MDVVFEQLKSHQQIPSFVPNVSHPVRAMVHATGAHHLTKANSKHLFAFCLFCLHHLLVALQEGGSLR